MREKKKKQRLRLLWIEKRSRKAPNEALGPTMGNSGRESHSKGALESGDLVGRRGRGNGEIVLVGEEQ